MKNIIQNSKFNCRVSSVLNRNAKEFGKTFLFDNKEDTCWNSDQGSPQWIDVEFEEAQDVQAFKLQFQGGFVGQDCTLWASVSGKELQEIQSIYPEDINPPQLFELDQPITTNRVRLLFQKSTDFFGRIIVYKFEILGKS